MNREEIIKTINDFLIEELEIDAERLKDDARLREDLKIDSLDFVDIAVIVEEHFKIKIKPEEMKNVKLLSQFYDYIENKMKEA
ncbi:MAG: phosphopantetheine-binding protein [Bacteroidales bacterium]|nr:phosphopantetheine-binding protein [Bacteroidales bacterium]